MDEQGIKIWNKTNDVLRLDCIRGNEAINRFYERAGYVACGECMDSPYHGILREKRLTNK